MTMIISVKRCQRSPLVVMMLAMAALVLLGYTLLYLNQSAEVLEKEFTSTSSLRTQKKIVLNDTVQLAQPELSIDSSEAKNLNGSQEMPLQAPLPAQRQEVKSVAKTQPDAPVQLAENEKIEIYTTTADDLEKESQELTHDDTENITVWNIERPADQNEKQEENDDGNPAKVSQLAESRPLLRDFLRCKDRELAFEKVQYGDYWLLRNYVVGSTSRNVGCTETLTYTTHGDYTFFDNLPTLVTHWQAPISFAIFAPGLDMPATMDSIQYVRQCLPESQLISEYVTFHIYFPAKHMPQSIPLTEKEALAWPYSCNATMAPYVNVSQTYKAAKKLTYPINVGRNIARQASNTYFIFACDIELIPTRNLPAMFLRMVERTRRLFDVDKKRRRVFVLPVFEVQKNASIPETKSELVEMLRSKQAVPFHSKLCLKCHKVPEQDKWLTKLAEENDGELSIVSVSKRLDKHAVWEPFYISDNTEPMFDERVTWEGQSNKRIQGYAMCLMNYDYFILDSVFLVHSPGIKIFDRRSPRLKYVPATNAMLRTRIKPEYTVLYGKNPKCKI